MISDSAARQRCTALWAETDADSVSSTVDSGCTRGGFMSKTGQRLVLLLVSVSLAACASSQPEKVRFSGSVPTRSDRDYENWPVEPLEAASMTSVTPTDVTSD